MKKEDRGTTGNFEVTILPTGQVLHSKRNNGQGRAETIAERTAIVNQICTILNSRS